MKTFVKVNKGPGFFILWFLNPLMNIFDRATTNNKLIAQTQNRLVLGYLATDLSPLVTNSHAYSRTSKCQWRKQGHHSQPDSNTLSDSCLQKAVASLGFTVQSSKQWVNSGCMLIYSSINVSYKQTQRTVAPQSTFNYPTVCVNVNKMLSQRMCVKSPPQNFTWLMMVKL